MSPEKSSFPYHYENVSLLDCESSLPCDETEEKVIRLALKLLISLRACAFRRLISALSKVCFCFQRCMFTSGESIQHDKASSDARRKLICAAILSVVFMVRDSILIIRPNESLELNRKVIELTGGYLAGSLAIMSDAAHLITDSLTFVVGAFGITWARKGASTTMNFGFKRVEVFCAIISIIGIWILTLFILYFAVQRLMNLDSFEINTDTMLIVSILGVLVNIV